MKHYINNSTLLDRIDSRVSQVTTFCSNTKNLHHIAYLQSHLKLSCFIIKQRKKLQKELCVNKPPHDSLIKPHILTLTNHSKVIPYLLLNNLENFFYDAEEQAYEGGICG